MKRIACFLIIICFCSAISATLTAASIGNKIYGVYSETFSGINYDTNNPPDTDGGHISAYTSGGNYPVISELTDISKEGYRYMKVFKNNNDAVNSMWIQFGYDGATDPQVKTNMSAYTGGQVAFWLINDTTVQFKIEWDGGGIAKTINTMHSTWTYLSYDLDSFTGIKYSSITIPASFIFPQSATGTVCYDNIIWKSTSTVNDLGIAIKNILDGSTTNQITWNGIDQVLGSTNPWRHCDQYLQLDLNYYTTGWGIQIYTDNLAADATPQFQQIGGNNPAGLVDFSSNTLVMPMCWRIVDVTTNTINIIQGSPGYPSRLWEYSLGNSYPCFQWLKDKGTSDFVNGNDDITVWDNRGIHHAEGGNWSGSFSPNYIYLGAKFQNAYTPRKYKTNKLTIELFYE